MEFAPEPIRPHETSWQRLEKTAHAYSEIISSDEAFLADIIVFPEGVLHDQAQAFELPEPSDQVSPCASPGPFHPALITLSCSARNARKYLVINVAEKMINATQHKVVFYNTNIVFDRRGVIVSRYRKFNLFNEPTTSVTADVELGHFTTDFNVTFGHFVCFDILFRSPALDLWTHLGIRDFAYPTMWFSELPFMSAVQTQNMWTAGVGGVNLLAAGANDPRIGSTGSGIFSRDGPIASIFTGVNGTRRILVAEVPKTEYWEDAEVQETFTRIAEEKEEVASVRLGTDDLSVYATKLLSFPTEGVSKTKESLCHGALCCDFEMVVVRREKESKGGQFYRHSIVVFDGVRNYGGSASGGVFTCALITCLNATLDSCGRMYDLSVEELAAQVQFQELKVSGRFRWTKDMQAMPNTMDYGLSPLRRQEYVFKVEKHEDGSAFNAISMELTGPRAHIYTFGIYGRDFAKDGQKPTSAAETSSIRNWILVVVALVGTYLGLERFQKRKLQ